MTIQRMDNVAIVVDDLDAAVAFFAELGMELEGKGQIEGLFADRTVGLDGVRSEIAMMRTPDGHSKLELTRYHAPAADGAGPEPAAQHTGPASRHVRCLPPRPRGHHRRPGRADRLTRACCGTAEEP